VANPSYTLITATGTFSFWPDWIQSPFNLSYAVEFAAGTSGTYTVSYTLDDPNEQIDRYGAVAWTPIWLADPTNGAVQTASAGGYYTFPIRGLRVIVSALSGGNARFAVLQGQSSR
jgi:hypothetical protein